MHARPSVCAIQQRICGPQQLMFRVFNGLSDKGLLFRPMCHPPKSSTTGLDDEDNKNNAREDETAPACSRRRAALTIAVVTAAYRTSYTAPHAACATELARATKRIDHRLGTRSTRFAPGRVISSRVSTGYPKSARAHAGPGGERTSRINRKATTMFSQSGFHLVSEIFRDSVQRFHVEHVSLNGGSGNGAWCRGESFRG